MANIEYIENPLPTKWGIDEDPAYATKPGEVSDKFYDTLIDKIDTAAKKIDTETKVIEKAPLTENETVSDLLKDTMEEAFGISGVGVDFSDAFEQMLPEDQEEFLNLMEKIMASIEAEDNGDAAEGTVQGLLDAIFGRRVVESDDPYDAVRLKLEALKKKDVSAEEAMQIILPMLLNISIDNTAVKAGEVVYGGGEEMTFGEFAHSMDAIWSEIKIARDFAASGEEIVVPEAPVTPEVPEITDDSEVVVTPEVPTDTTENPEVTDTTTDSTEVPEVTDTTETPETPETPEVTDTTENTEVTDEVTDEAGTATETTVPVESIEVETLSADASRLMSASSIARSSANITTGTDELNEIAAASMVNADMQTVVTAEAAVPEATANSVHTQVVDFITGQMSSVREGDTNRLTMTLNPDNLGRITVEVTNDGGEITIRIAAESAETQSLLRDRLPSLMQDLSNINNGVREIQMVEPSYNGAAADLNLSNGGDSNAAQQQYTQSDAVEMTQEEESPETILKGENRLWQMA